MIDEGRVPPNAVNFERMIIGAVLLEPEALFKAANIIHVDCFYMDSHKWIWQAVLSLYSKEQAIDMETVCNELKEVGKLGKIGETDSMGVYYIAKLTNTVGSSANIETHCHIVKERYIARQLISACSNALKSLYDVTEDVFDTKDKLQNDILKLDGEINKSREVKFSDAVVEAAAELKEAAKDKTYKTGQTVGLDSLDRHTMGWQDSDLIILAGRPSMGKTAFAVWCAKQQAKQGVPTGFMSLEMSTKQLIHRIFADESNIELSTIRKAGMRFDEWQRFDQRLPSIIDFPLHIDDRGGLRITEVCSTITTWAIKHKVKTVYIDYLQLIAGSGEKKQANREQDVSEVTRKLKALAKNLNIPIIALSQLSRAVETRGGDKKPMLSDLRESGAIEQDADMVIFPFCPSYYDEQADPFLCELIIAKYRNGKVGMVEVDFNKAFQKFKERSNPF